MRNTKDLALDLDKLKLHILVYGISGTGKTTFAGTFPKPYFFDFDRGMLSLRGQDISYETYLDEDLTRPDAYRRFLEQMHRFKKSLNGFETIVVDSLTTLSESMMYHIQFLNGTITKQPTLQDWGMGVAKLRDLFHEIMAFDCHTIVTAHEEMIKDELSGEIVNRPLVIGQKLPPRIPLWFDEIYRAQVGRDKNRNPVYQLLTTAMRRYTAKSRMNGKLKCFEELEVPDYKSLMKKIKGGE